MNWKALTTGPAALAALLTLGNALKLPVVDDTAYLLFARHLAAHPLDPYGWELFWYRAPEPAMSILLPPVLPYWLAAGIGLFGEQPTLLKLWLFPICYLFTRSVWALFARFAPGWERPGTTLTTLGPAVLPLVNFMLDVPAAALGLAAVAAFVRGCDGLANRRSGCAGHDESPSPAQPDLRWLVTAGLLAGLAVQTKYTALTLPAVFVAYALTRRRLLPAVVATAVAAAVFVAWEGFLFARYGQSHFREQLREQAVGGSFADKLELKLALFRPLVAQLGGLAAAWALLAGRVLGVGRWPVAVMATTLAVGYAAVAVTPAVDTVLLRNGATGSPRLDLPALVYLSMGYATLAAAVALGWRLRGAADGRFLALWGAVELAGYFALSPFPAARRVIPTVLVLGLLVGRAVTTSSRPWPRWPVGFGIACGVGLLALDTWDATVEPAGVTAAADIIGDHDLHAVWTQGHWGWQYAADRRGWRLVEPGRSRLVVGDWLVLPVEPDPYGFYRPYHGGAKLALDLDRVVPVGEWAWQDRLAGQTVPNLYGGVYPVVGRDRTHPRLRVRVYRVTADWVPASAGTP